MRLRTKLMALGTGVSCTAPATCTAVGFWSYEGGGPTGQTLAEHKQGS